MNRKQFQRLAALRLREAKLLLSAKSPNGAYYLAGYAVECGLKACIAKRTERYDFPDKKRVMDSHTHDVMKLIQVADLKASRDEAMRQLDFANYWETVVEWSEESRYKDNSLEDADDLIEAIENRKYGVLPWLKKFW